MKKDFICIGHRGAMGHAPENTLLSIEKALEFGVKWIEIDVYCVEGKLIVIHDDRLERTTNGKGYVQNQNIKYIRSLDAGKGQRIPFLEEVIKLIEGRASLNIELKGINTAEEVLKSIHANIKTRKWKKENFLISSFNHHELNKVKLYDPKIRTGALICALPLDYASFGSILGAYSINPSIEFVNSEFIKDAHKRGMKVLVYTVNHPEDMRKMYDLGADGIFTNYPDVFFDLFG
ncbi:MAG TPA: glycerophosphodiester phosphodiesterase [Lentisphaeria bacterium]|nr:MAG: glycerophosphodiester phosphodiesterase [Lentisphaerae bacterium GWF2_38_69]HBM15676.1 glycerophosphodiester phosphodiesterase [Lentisphaeria bacterium]